MSPGVLRFSLAMSAGVAMVGLWYALSGPSESHGHAASSAPGGSVAAAPSNAHDVRPTTPAAAGSLEDAARLFELGVSGDLSLDMHTRSALDILQASLGPDPTPADYQRLEEALRRSMPGEAATQAMGLVRRYVAYSRAAAADAATQTQPTTTAELQALLEKSAALRREHFDAATARALFGAEEEQTRLDLALNAIQANTRLSDSERAAQIQALREQAPRDLPGLWASASPEQSQMEAQIAALRQQGATPAQIEQVRQRYLGDDSAKALAATEAIRDSWESRYQAYAQQKKALMASATPDLQAKLETALRQHFAEDELAAARAYERHRTP